ncbi:MAG: hypothetical protein OXH13_07920 [Chloroflexi bacterium]|nr:hypothetical protein [Chloroflexota bacterium]MCY3696772.1 hypothetical protein [Chloroflexota bacterium]
MRQHHFLLAIALPLVLGLTLSACRPTFEDDIEEAQVEAARATEAAQRAQIIAALEPLNPLRYHHLDAIVRNEQRIPADAVIWATRAHETLGWVDWPLELQEHVTQYADWIDALLVAFREDSAQAAAEPSKIVHALAHTFEATLEAWLSNESLPAVPELAGLEPPMHDVPHGGHDE